MYVCICKGLTEDNVRRVGGAGITAPDALIRVLGLDDEICCGRCPLNIQEFVVLAESAKSSLRTAPAAGRLNG